MDEAGNGVATVRFDPGADDMDQSSRERYCSLRQSSSSRGFCKTSTDSYQIVVNLQTGGAGFL